MSSSIRISIECPELMPTVYQCSFLINNEEFVSFLFRYLAPKVQCRYISFRVELNGICFFLSVLVTSRWSLFKENHEWPCKVTMMLLCLRVFGQLLFFVFSEKMWWKMLKFLFHPTKKFDEIWWLKYFHAYSTRGPCNRGLIARYWDTISAHTSHPWPPPPPPLHSSATAGTDNLRGKLNPLKYNGNVELM